MGIAISILAAAVGAILRFAVTVSSHQHGFNVHTVGLILMVAGGVGVLLSVLFWSSFAPFGQHDRSITRRDETTTQDGHEQGRVVRETRDHVSH
jgi:hypothetical protein